MSTRIATRQEVYAAIDGERRYQDALWDDYSSPNKQTVEAWLVYMQDYLTEAMHIISRGADSTAKPKALASIRKITAMGVACMEQNGAPERNVL